MGLFTKDTIEDANARVANLETIRTQLIGKLTAAESAAADLVAKRGSIDDPEVDRANQLVRSLGERAIALEPAIDVAREALQSAEHRRVSERQKGGRRLRGRAKKQGHVKHMGGNDVESCDTACHVLISTPELRLRNTGVG